MVKKWTVNPFTGKIDATLDKSYADGRYVNVPGDTMTGALVITPTTGTESLRANKDIVLKTGQRLIFDGA